MLEQALSGRGQLNAAAVTVQKRVPQLHLKGPDMPAQGRLRYAEHQRGSRKTPNFGDTYEMLDLSQIHGDLIT
ncbi:MAG TPA: hypothetical protein VNQ97_02100 [Burkholderiaceae bacterium]|nr:hypothetical protein [Burkholderiaceae bacterium]